VLRVGGVNGFLQASRDGKGVVRNPEPLPAKPLHYVLGSSFLAFTRVEASDKPTFPSTAVWRHDIVSTRGVGEERSRGEGLPMCSVTSPRPTSDESLTILNTTQPPPIERKGSPKGFTCCVKIPNVIRRTLSATSRNPSLPVRPRSSGLTDLSRGGERFGSDASILRSRLRLLGSIQISSNSLTAPSRWRGIRVGWRSKMAALEWRRIGALARTGNGYASMTGSRTAHASAIGRFHCRRAFGRCRAPWGRGIQGSSHREAQIGEWFLGEN